MAGEDVVSQRVSEILRIVKPDAKVRAVRYVEDVNSWEVEIESDGSLYIGRIPAEWLDEPNEEKILDRLQGLSLKEGPG